MKENDEPAFPVDAYGLQWPTSPGMTLRDYFAAAALNGFLSGTWGVDSKQAGAKICYEWADAMLMERSK